MYAVAAKTAKKKGDTSKSDDRYAYEETIIERPFTGYEDKKKVEVIKALKKKEHIKKIDNIKNDKIKKSLLELSKIFKPKWKK